MRKIESPEATLRNWKLVKKLILCIFLSVFIGANAEGQTLTFKPSFSIVADTSIGPIILSQCSRSTPEHGLFLDARQSGHNTT